MKLELLKASVKTFLDRYATPEKIPGDGAEICTTIIDRLWNGTFYQTGLHHFDYFWMRDFGVVAQSLVNLGFADRVEKTVVWALAQYMRAGTLGTCISRTGGVFNAPIASVDALPWLIQSIKITGISLTAEQKKFLEDQMAQYYVAFINPETGTLKGGVDLCELRDAARYTQSAYTVGILSMLADTARALGLKTQLLEGHAYARVLRSEYWNGSYFSADSNNTAFSIECNLFPLWLNVVEDTDMLDSVIGVIHERALAHPHPIRYTDESHAFTYRWWEKILMPNYAGTTIWTWHGVIYLHMLKRADAPAFKDVLASFENLLQKHNTFPELLNADGSWYKTPFYQAERGMIWAALYLDLLKTEKTVV